MTCSEYTISKIRVRVVGGETGYVSKIEWTSEGTFQPIGFTLDDGRVVNYYDGWYIEEILPDKDDFEERLRALLLEYDISKDTIPDYDLPGATLWEYYLEKIGEKKPFESSVEMEKYGSELNTARLQKRRKDKP